MKSHETIVVLDFGSQYTQLIARRIREKKVYSVILPCTARVSEITKHSPRALVLSGGPASLTAARAPLPDPGIFKLGLPMLGICYGMQAQARILGGKVEGSSRREYGFAEIRVTHPDDLFAGLGKKVRVWMSHGDHVVKVPPGFRVAAASPACPIAAMSDSRKKWFGLQFHPEVSHTPRGSRIFENFLYRVAGCSGEWTIQSFIEREIEEVRKKVGEEGVLLGLSGGVDSSALSLLLFRALGEKLVCVFIDNGLLRKGEAELVKEVFEKRVGLNLILVDARQRFLQALSGVVDPERKRKIIGREFIRVFENEARKLGKIKYLAQGTLYPDLIESRSAFGGPSATIKSHHNVGGLPRRMDLKLIEPFRELFKDEVRQVGKQLGLPEEIVWRHPVPGPGLAVRIIGEITPRRLEILRDSDAIVLEEIHRAGLDRKIWQVFAVLLPVKSVGVMGDQRTYQNVLAVRAVTSTDGMTADWARIPYRVLQKISSRVISEVRGINRVVYDISQKPPSTIEWE